MTDRSCGKCSACCTALAIDDPELQKPEGERCQHLTVSGGCGIYLRRPEICKQFRCAWLGGNFKATDRPDKIGVMLHVPQSGEGPLVGVLTELRPGALSGPRAGAIRKLSRAKLVTLVRRRNGQENVEGPQNLLDKFLEDAL